MRGGEERRAQEAGRLFHEINNGNFPAREAAALLRALNSSGQYALSSGIINADLVAQGAGGWREGVQLCAVNCAQPAACVCAEEPGKASSQRHWGQEGSRLVLSELFKVNRGFGPVGPSCWW